MVTPRRCMLACFASSLALLACLAPRTGTSDENDGVVDTSAADAFDGDGDRHDDASPADTTTRPDAPLPPDATTQPDTGGPPDTVTPPDTGVADSGAGEPETIGPIVAGLPPGGPWQREIIGDCIQFIETIAWSPSGEVSWLFEDDNACRGPSPAVTSLGRAASPRDHRLAIALERADLFVPTELTWTWAVLPGQPRRLHTAAFRRVGQSERFVREDLEVRGDDENRSEKRLELELRLPGYPEVREMVLAFDVSWRFAAEPDADRGGAGRLNLPARRVTTADGRVAIAAEGFDPNAHPDHYRFQQLLLERFDGHTVDLVAEAFFPVLYEVEGDPASLVFERWDRIWTEVRP